VEKLPLTLKVAGFESTPDWLHIEPLAGNAHDLNPLETLWSNVNGRRLSNLCAADLGSVANAARHGLAHVARHPTLAKSFLAHAGLNL
jgi:hypothetical protein